MSEDPKAARDHETLAPRRGEPSPEPVASVLPGSGVSDLLRRLELHRAAGARHQTRDLIGSGGMGEILRVQDQDLGRDLAMKVLRRDAASLPEGQRARLLARFLEEAQVTGQLHHPSIVPVHELSIDAEGQPFFTMPLIRGADFGEIISFVHGAERGWTLPRALAIVLKVCEALSYAHARGVIHRDVKPGNVRVGRFGETYVMDWGLARVLGRKETHDLRISDPAVPASSAVRTDRSKLKQEAPDSPLVTMDGDVVGTPHYMSPEQARGDTEHVDGRSDVYSVGALLYHLLAARPPYAPESGALSPRAVWSLVLDGPPKELSGVAPGAPLELVDIVRKAMARDSAERYPDMPALARDLEAYLGRRPVGAHPPTVGYALRLLYERNRQTFRLGAIAAVVLVVLGSLFASVMRSAWRDEQRAQRLADDGLLIAGLLDEARALHPATPRELPRFDSWIGAADELLARESSFRGWLEELRGLPHSEIGREAEVAGTLGLHLTRLGALGAERVEVARRREFAAGLDRLSLREPAQLWAEVCAEVNASGALGAEPLAPQIGLVPLGKNPEGLFEFWHVASGERPVAGGGGARVPRAEDGIVLVLLTGGTFEMGSPEDQRGRGVTAREPLHSVRISPLFVAKHEVTQGQWLRAMGSNPSRYRPENQARGSFTLLHPVESLDWGAAGLFAARLDLRLLTEAEWEFAARAGARSAYPWGDDVGGLEGRENLLDESARREAATPPAAWNDGFSKHAPVGTFLPNGFGLHDMLGNVGEWCSDLYAVDPLAGPSTERDESPGIPLRVIRGGCFYFGPRNGNTETFRPAFRYSDTEHSVQPLRGLRVARDCRPSSD